jgi:hypothetical protein
MHGPIKLKYQELISVFSQSHALFLMRLSTAFNFHISILYPVTFHAALGFHAALAEDMSGSFYLKHLRYFLSEICLTFVAFFSIFCVFL